VNCRACSHPDRDAIDRQIVAGTPLRAIAASSDLSLGGLVRHKQCIRKLLNQAMESDRGERAERGSALHDRVEKLVGEAEQVLAKAKAKDDFRGAVGALGAAAKLLDLLGRVSGELQSANSGGIHLTKITNVNVTNYDNDRDFAAMVGEATRGFDVRELMRLKAIAESAVATLIAS
jgi:hypothetical protein